MKYLPKAEARVLACILGRAHAAHRKILLPQEGFTVPVEGWNLCSSQSTHSSQCWALKPFILVKSQHRPAEPWGTWLIPPAHCYLLGIWEQNPGKGRKSGMKIPVSANQNEEGCRRRERICPKAKPKSRQEEINCLISSMSNAF